MTFNWSAFFAAVWPWVKARLQEKTTYFGLIMAGAALLGKTLAPETVGHYADIAVLAAGMLIGTPKQ